MLLAYLKTSSLAFGNFLSRLAFVYHSNRCQLIQDQLGFLWSCWWLQWSHFSANEALSLERRYNKNVPAAGSQHIYRIDYFKHTSMNGQFLLIFVGIEMALCVSFMIFLRVYLLMLHAWRRLIDSHDRMPRDITNLAEDLTLVLQFSIRLFVKFAVSPSRLDVRHAVLKVKHLRLKVLHRRGDVRLALIIDQ